MVIALPQRKTRQRQVILDELRNLASHPSAAELYEIVRRRLPKISLGTVYRNLDQLVEAGEILKLEIAGSQARFDGNVSEHHHVRCVQCGRVADIHNLPVEPVSCGITTHDNYEILGYHLEFTGLCPECRKQRTENTQSAHN